MLNGVARFVRGNADSRNGGRAVNAVRQTDDVCARVEVVGHFTRHMFNLHAAHAMGGKHALRGLGTGEIVQVLYFRILVKSRIDAYLRNHRDDDCRKDKNHVGPVEPIEKRQSLSHLSNMHYAKSAEPAARQYFMSPQKISGVHPLFSLQL